MQPPIHTIEALFEQLGLDSSEEGIEKFVSTHKPIPKKTDLHDAKFWSPSQAAFLAESISQDADWAEVVDHLDVMLRE